jgi:hypothetical protein
MKQYVTLHLAIITKETDKAMYVIYTHKHNNMGLAAWLPKSQISESPYTVEDEDTFGIGGQIYQGALDTKNKLNARIVDLTIPTWLCKKNMTQSHNPNHHYSK